MFTLRLYTGRDLAITHPSGSPGAGSADLQIPGYKLKGIQPPWVLMPKVVEISLPCVAPWCEGSLFLPLLQADSLHLSNLSDAASLYLGVEFLLPVVGSLSGSWTWMFCS